MKKIAIVYASMTGNTEDIAHMLAERLTSFEVDLLEMAALDVDELDPYDGVLIGSYTYDDGELPFESEDFFEQLDDQDLTGKVVGCFGSGDTNYEHFCAAVHHFQEKVAQCGADVVENTLDIDLSPEGKEDQEACTAFVTAFIRQLTYSSSA